MKEVHVPAIDVIHIVATVYLVVTMGFDLDKQKILTIIDKSHDLLLINSKLSEYYE